jgi:ADP-ribose pyrophosphatase YjhB (NUDIX family)
MKFCNLCGTSLSLRIPQDDDRQRHVCDQCGHVHYQNPRIIVCAIPAWEDRVLLCKRAIEPQYGLWTLPGGFMENDETTQQAAARETLEEAGADIEVHDLYSMFNVMHINQVHLFFLASLKSPHWQAGKESLEVGLFTRDEIPWQEIAFPAVASTLRQYFADLPEKKFPLKLGDVIITPDNRRLIRSHNFDHDDS